MTRLCLTVAYRGTSFHGFARQPGDIETVARSLETALARVFQQEVQITCAGRTDAGVHALGQVISFDVDKFSRSLDSLVSSLNKMLTPNIFVSAPEVVDRSFDARFSATARAYRYSISDSPLFNPMLGDTVWFVRRPLDVEAMNRGAQALLGEHDFSSFCRRVSPELSLVRLVHRATWRRDGELVLFEIEGNAFCHQMVRSLVGELVEVGKGKSAPENVEKVLNARNRSVAAPIAPPHGLCLMKVSY